MIYVSISLLVIIAIYYVFLRKRDLPNGPWGLPILGYLPFLNPKAPHETLTQLSRKYGSIYGLSLGTIYTVVLSDSSLIFAAFTKDKVTGRAPLYVTHGIMGGYGLICAEGEMWKIHRKFSIKCLRQLGATKPIGPKTKKIEELIMKEVLDSVENIKRESKVIENDGIDPLDTLQHNLGSIMFQLVFGKSWTRNDKTWLWLQHLQEVGTKAIGVAGPLNFLPFLRYVPKFNKVMTFLLDGKHKTHEIYQKLIEEQQANFDVSNSTLVPENIIQAFLMEKHSTQDIEFFSDQQFYHLLADIFGAGLDTTLTTLRWYILYMATHPHYQTEVQKELDFVISDRLLTLEDLPNLPLTRAALAEVQRIRSVVPVGIPHATTEVIEIFGFRIPKNTMIVPLQWAIHMNPDVWMQPNEYNPYRFIDEEGKFFKPKEFIPFQTGKRMCIGDELANMLLFLFGATILQKFDISPHENFKVDLEGEIGITLTPKPVKLVFTSRVE